MSGIEHEPTRYSPTLLPLIAINACKHFFNCPIIVLVSRPSCPLSVVVIKQIVTTPVHWALSRAQTTIRAIREGAAGRSSPPLDAPNWPNAGGPIRIN